MAMQDFASFVAFIATTSDRVPHVARIGESATDRIAINDEGACRNVLRGDFVLTATLAAFFTSAHSST